MNARWKTVRLSEIALIGAGNSAPQETDDFSEDGPLFVRTSDVGEVKFGTVVSARDRLSSRGAKGMRLWKSGTILIPKSGASTFVNHRVILGTDAHVSSHLATIAADTAKADPRFLLYYLSTVRAQDLIQDQSYPSLKLPEIGCIEIPLPALGEQKRIVALLDEAFAGLDEAKSKAAACLAGSKSLIDCHLRAVFCEQTSGWEKSTIGAEMRFIDYRGKTPAKTASGIRLITAKNVKMGHLQDTPMEFIAVKDYEKWMTRGIPRKGDVLFTTEAPLANVAQLDTDEKVAFAQRIIILQPNTNRLNSAFLKYLLISQPVQERIRAKATGATVQGIKASLLKLIEISFPQKITTQEEIVAKMETLSVQARNLAKVHEHKIEALNELKKSILTQAFAGELTA
jgi:type I restriction enzyme S subunit